MAAQFLSERFEHGRSFNGRDFLVRHFCSRSPPALKTAQRVGPEMFLSNLNLRFRNGVDAPIAEILEHCTPQFGNDFLMLNNSIEE